MFCSLYDNGSPLYYEKAFGFLGFYDKIGECSLCGCVLIKITHVGGTLMIPIFDHEISSKSMLLLMRRHLVFYKNFTIKMGDFSEADLRVSLRNEGRDYN